MPSIPLHIGIPEDSHLKNEGDRQKTLFFLYSNGEPFNDKAQLYRHQNTAFSPTKYTFVGIKGIPLPLTKCRLEGLEDTPRDRRG